MLFLVVVVLVVPVRLVAKQANVSSNRGEARENVPVLHQLRNFPQPVAGSQNQYRIEL